MLKVKTIPVETILYSLLNYKTTILCACSSQHIKFLAPLPGIDSLFLTISILNKLGFNLEFLFYFFNSFYFSFAGLFWYCKSYGVVSRLSSLSRVSRLSKLSRVSRQQFPTSPSTKKVPTTDDLQQLSIVQWKRYTKERFK